MKALAILFAALLALPVYSAPDVSKDQQIERGKGGGGGGGGHGSGNGNGKGGNGSR